VQAGFKLLILLVSPPRAGITGVTTITGKLISLTASHQTFEEEVVRLGVQVLPAELGLTPPTLPSPSVLPARLPGSVPEAPLFQSCGLSTRELARASPHPSHRMSSRVRELLGKPPLSTSRAGWGCQSSQNALLPQRPQYWGGGQGKLLAWASLYFLQSCLGLCRHLCPIISIEHGSHMPSFACTVPSARTILPPVPILMVCRAAMPLRTRKVLPFVCPAGAWVQGCKDGFRLPPDLGSFVPKGKTLRGRQ
jgi:hypothetical protein